MSLRLLVSLVLASLSPLAGAKEKSIRVFIALCDNASQGIAPVPAKIGEWKFLLANPACSAKLPVRSNSGVAQR